MERTIETAQAIAAHHPHLTVQELPGVNEVDFGAWQGQALKELAQRKGWGVVQMYPSRAQFPQGETFRQAQARAVDAVETTARAHPRGRVVITSHSDIIRLIAAHYLGVHLDNFQRIQIAPASITTLALGPVRHTLVSLNDFSHCPPPPTDNHHPHG
jgi:probable phosphoglycerate mutase